MKKKIIIFILYIMASFLALIYLISDFTKTITLSEAGRLFLLGGSCFFLYFAGLLLAKLKSNNQPMKVNLWLFFILYLILLATLTLFDSMWGRNGLTFINIMSQDFTSYLKNSINLIPFKTIISFLKQFNSMYSNRTILLNLFGNFIALMPFAFFLPLLFKKQTKFKNFFLTIVLIVLGIELLQLLTLSGRFDIDDFILNVSGATLMYFILKIKDVNNLIRNIFLRETNKISKKSLILIAISLLLVLLGAILLVKFRSKLYDKNFDDYLNLHYPEVEIIDKSDGICKEGLDLFYDDEFYNYYFPCLKSDYVYAIVNSSQEYLVKDFIGEKTKYNYDINNLLARLDFYEIAYLKKEKYNAISFKIPLIKKENSLIAPDAKVFITRSDILEAKFDYKNAEMENGYYFLKLYLIPKKEGTLSIKTTFHDKEGNLLETYNYSITIDKDLNTLYTIEN